MLKSIVVVESFRRKLMVQRRYKEGFDGTKEARLAALSIQPKKSIIHSLKIFFFFKNQPSFDTTHKKGCNSQVTIFFCLKRGWLFIFNHYQSSFGTTLKKGC
jgi:hypothetical protein